MGRGGKGWSEIVEEEGGGPVGRQQTAINVQLGIPLSLSILTFIAQQ